MIKEYTRNCPGCDKKLSYQRPGKLKLAIENNAKCLSCSQKGKPKSDITKEKLSKKLTLYYQNHPANFKGCKHTKEAIEKNRQAHLGKSAWNKGKINCQIITEDTKQKLSYSIKKSWQDPIIRKKYFDALEKTKWLKVRPDIGQIEFIEKWNKLGFNFEINYQLHVDDFLCYIDGYDKEKNVVMEYDSKYHFYGKQKQKHLVRQQKIIDILKPKKFWRYNSTNQQIKNILEN